LNRAEKVAALAAYCGGQPADWEAATDEELDQALDQYGVGADLGALQEDLLLMAARHGFAGGAVLLVDLKGRAVATFCGKDPATRLVTEGVQKALPSVLRTILGGGA